MSPFSASDVGMLLEAAGVFFCTSKASKLNCSPISACDVALLLEAASVHLLPLTTQFTSFTSTKVQILTPAEQRARCRPHALGRPAQFTCFTSTKVLILPGGCRCGPHALGRPALRADPGTKFTCFTRTKVQLPTPAELRGRA